MANTLGKEMFIRKPRATSLPYLWPIVFVTHWTKTDSLSKRPFLSSSYNRSTKSPIRPRLLPLSDWLLAPLPPRYRIQTVQESQFSLAWETGNAYLFWREQRKLPACSPLRPPLPPPQQPTSLVRETSRFAFSLCWQQSGPH